MEQKFKLYMRPIYICRTHETNHEGMDITFRLPISSFDSAVLPLKDLWLELRYLSRSHNLVVNHLIGKLLSLLLSSQIVVRLCLSFCENINRNPLIFAVLFCLNGRGFQSCQLWFQVLFPPTYFILFCLYHFNPFVRSLLKLPVFTMLSEFALLLRL